ncbi:MAG: NAD(P)/FAD-dependent oxidoreductase [Myxococcota bacterium]
MTNPNHDEPVDAVIVGSGPNGLAAAIALAQGGASVLVLEAHDEPGGGTRTAELTLPGFRHDVCSACHPMGRLSPFFRSLPLARHGLVWRDSDVSVAHPLDDEPAVLLRTDLDATAEALGIDAEPYRRLVEPFLANPHGLLADALGPLRIPRHPFVMARFGLQAIRSARGLATGWFDSERARALVAGCAGHAVIPLEAPVSAAIALIFLITAHVEPWPVAEGGSQAIPRALLGVLEELGGRVKTGVRVTSLAQLPPSRVVLFDTDPGQLASIAESALPARYVDRLRRYRYGPGSFKVDWALSEAIPWADPEVGRAATVHLGGTLDEIAFGERAAWDGQDTERPYVLLVQQSALDPTRAPEGQHTGYAYCHVPSGSPRDYTAIIEAQVERFAPGFRDTILARHTTSTRDFAAYNPNFVGGAVTGGAADLTQLFTRPVARLNPYTTPNPRLFIGSASTPPGGGVHGMGGYFAAQAALRRLGSLEPMRW